MITFPHLGYLGRLGNQMFQYAALLSLSNKNNTTFSISKSDIELYKCFNIPSKICSYYNVEFIGTHNLGSEIVPRPNTLFLRNNEQWISLLNTNFDSSFFNIDHNNKSIFGFFQNYQYFGNNEEELKKHYTFKQKYSDKSNFYINQNFKDNKIISLHIRRTDYLNSEVLNKLDVFYYENALEHFDKSIPVLVFSDDINWCKEQNIFKENRFKIIKTNNTYIDLCLMSKCNYHIIANSSFSWWGSWLADSEKTICPKDWFSPQFSCLDSEGLRLKKWIAI